MANHDIYADISRRTDGDIYLGVVGPVRTGKSTFIKRFMDLLVLPNIENEYSYERARDELPQSASGRTIMTTEPKFIPNEAYNISLDESLSFNVRLVDCVGYMVDGALGHIENEIPRMVSTPWHDHQIPFEESAEIGTRKVITDHSTIGIVLTTDGSFSEIAREAYMDAEERVISELKEIEKPFVVVLNSINPNAQSTQRLKAELEVKYMVPVICIDCINMNEDDINNILESVLYEFPISNISVNVPSWIETLDEEHWLKDSIIKSIMGSVDDIYKLTDIRNVINAVSSCENIDKIYTEKINLGNGNVEFNIMVKEGLFYKILEELTDLKIENDGELIELMKDFSKIKTEYEKIEYALHQVKTCGYGIVTPALEEMVLEEPEIFRYGSKFGVKLRAKAPSVHMIRADIQTEIAPLVGTEKQSEELVSYLMNEFESDPSKIWSSNIFGKSLHDLVTEGLQNKLGKMPDNAKFKIKETLGRIINEGSGGLICIIL